MTVELYLRAPDEKRRPPPGVAAVIHLDEPGVPGYPLHHNLARLPATPGLPGQAVTAFLSLALGVWAADKFLARRAAPDAWTREITLHLPVSPGWLPLAPRLGRPPQFSHRGRLEPEAREASLDLGLKGEWPHPWRPDGVMLFSGGLDSLIGALDRLEAGERLLLVSHYDFGQLAGTQQTLAAALLRPLRPRPGAPPGAPGAVSPGPGALLRSRSLLYLALGLATAASFGAAHPPHPPGKRLDQSQPAADDQPPGQLQHPHHPSPISWSSSRRLWQRAGLANPLVNPYQDLTKGEMVRRCRNRDLLGQLFGMSVSCSRPVVSRWQGGAAGACGYCYPCLMRRAALHTLGWDRGEDYRRDVLSDPETLAHRVRGRDLRALLLAVKTWEDAPAEVEARLMVGDAPETLPARFLPRDRVLDRGFREIAGWLRDKGPEWVGG